MLKQITVCIIIIIIIYMDIYGYTGVLKYKNMVILYIWLFIEHLGAVQANRWRGEAVWKQ